MTWQPTLRSDLLLLRPLRVDDWDALSQAASDPLIWQQHPQPTRYQSEVFSQFFAEALASRGALAVIDRQTNAVIGSSRFTDQRMTAESAIEIGYTFLTRPYWGGLYNRALKTMMLEHAFVHVELVCFVVGQNNWRSRRAMEKIGGELWLENAGLPVAADFANNVVFTIARSDWSTSTAADTLLVAPDA